jgi:hypothetical protein
LNLESIFFRPKCKQCPDLFIFLNKLNHLRLEFLRKIPAEDQNGRKSGNLCRSLPNHFMWQHVNGEKILLDFQNLFLVWFAGFTRTYRRTSATRRTTAG